MGGDYAGAEPIAFEVFFCYRTADAASSYSHRDSTQIPGPAASADPNTITQMSKYFWAVLSFGGEPSSDGFAKCYEMHYQSKKIAADGFKKF
jgi:hypothetical protein